MSLSPAKQDIYYYNKDSITKSYIITNKITGAAVNLSDDTLTLTIKKKKSETAITTLTTTAGTITVSGVDGNIVNLHFNNDLEEERAFFQDLYNNTLDRTMWYGKLIVTIESHD